MIIDHYQFIKRSLAEAIDRDFISLSVALLVLYTGLLIPFYFISSITADQGVPDGWPHRMIAITYLGSFIGRIAGGGLASVLGW
jgi:hypothetical protein